MYVLVVSLNPITVIISIHLFLLINIPFLEAQALNHTKYYSDCSSATTVRCGEATYDQIHYPLWGENIRPKYCGLEGFELSCENTNLVIDIGYGSMPLEDLLASSFGVHYKINHTACSDCGKSGGECWKNTDLGVDPKCLRQPGYAVGSSYQVPQKGNNTVSGRKIIIAASAAGGGMLLLLSVLLLLVLLILCFRKKTKNGSSGVSQYVSSNNVLSESEKAGTYMGIPTFSYSELEEATNNFDSNYELGNGGFGTVYKGKLRDGREVAVKRVYENSFKRVEQFMNEITILTGLRHPNLVVLYGSTSHECKVLLLVYEYIPNGTIADHLNRDSAQPGKLTWNTRMSIAIETASALLYLHVSDVIHRDVKTTNILLDNSFRVKVADFGLSRLFPTNVTHVSTVPQGTPGYVDPEYYQCYQLTDKSDVYSFGVVLIELISSMPAVDISRHRHEINLANLAIKKIQGDALHELVDPTLGFESDEEVRKMIMDVAELALRCLQNERELRPSMEEVHRSLKEIQRTDCAKEILRI
uniref:Protein kinase domain-containing protein n=1 Tax=Daucus carota subsp. sativus TaxID=79200 RepID=A0A166BBL2_DAUCS